MRRPIRSALPLVLALGVSAIAAAAEPAKDSAKPSAREQLESLRPSGPVTVKADHVDWVQDSSMKYSGNVSLHSDTLTVHGDEMQVQQFADGNFLATIHGKPARLDHAPKPEAAGVAAQPVSADAREIRYDSRNGTADLAGAARLRRGADEINGETIGYIVGERRVRAASGGGNGQVTITFEPPPPKSATEKKIDGRTRGKTP